MEIFDDKGQITYLAHVCALSPEKLVEGEKYMCVYVYNKMPSKLKVRDIIVAPSDPSELPILSAYYPVDENNQLFSYN